MQVGDPEVISFCLKLLLNVQFNINFLLFSSICNCFSLLINKNKNILNYCHRLNNRN